eukprot:COSAG01_NODE_331_length_18718_cov_21.881358_11_plen_65_part_00
MPQVDKNQRDTGQYQSKWEPRRRWTRLAHGPSRRRSGAGGPGDQGWHNASSSASRTCPAMEMMP